MALWLAVQNLTKENKTVKAENKIIKTENIELKNNIKELKAEVTKQNQAMQAKINQIMQHLALKNTEESVKLGFKY